jgi:thioredoxin reductase (NADPH)
VTAPNPAIVLVSEHHVDTLQDEFGRYARDYDVCAATSFAEAAACVRKVLDAGGQVAMVVSESVLPDADVLHAFHKLRERVPTARRVIAAHWDR